MGSVIGTTATPAQIVPTPTFTNLHVQRMMTPSSIEVESVRLLATAVLQIWRDTLETGDLDQLQQPNPP